MDLSRIAEVLPSLARFLPDKPAAGSAPSAPSAYTPAPARVNLIPAAALERAAAARGRKTGTTIFVASLAGVGALFAGGALTSQQLNANIDELNAEKERIGAEVAVYAPVTNVAAQTNALTETVNNQTAGEVLHGEVLSLFVEAANKVGSVRSVALSTGEGGSACQSVDPFNQRSLVGCVTFTVAASAGQADAARLISALSANPVFVDAFIPTVSSSGSESVLTGTVGVTDAALTLTASIDGLKGVDVPDIEEDPNGESVADDNESGDA